MTRDTRRSVAVLVVLLAILAAVLVFRRSADLPAGTPTAPSNSRGGAARAAQGGEGPTDVRIELLHDEPEVLTEASRNPFRFEEKAPPPPPPRPPREEPQVFAPPAPTGPPPPPPIPLRFIGYVAARDGALVASFSDGRGNVFHGKEGDIIEGRYKVLRVGTDSVELAYLDGRGRQTIRLSGQ